jgi:hypothetical protein
MGTRKQKKLAKITLDNPNLPKGELVEMGGYGPSVIKTPAKVLESPGYKDELRKLGLTEEFVTGALVEDIEKKPQNRLGELRLASEILDMSNREGGGSKNLILIVTGESAQRYGISPTSNPETSST